MLETGTIISNEKLTGEHSVYSMLIRSPKIAKLAKPGQFVMVNCGGKTILRRPISICDAQDGNIRLCYDLRGEGTLLMSRFAENSTVDLIGPIGNGFDISDTNKKVLLVGGGIGIYPLYMTAARFGANAVAALGFRAKSFITMETEFESVCGSLHIATDDGSYGHTGYVIEIVRGLLDKENFDIIMTCGPKVMMKGVAAEAKSRGIRCQVSLEERMGCGVGACLSCVCKTTGNEGTGMKRVCVDGPVFNAQEVDFNEQ